MSIWNRMARGTLREDMFDAVCAGRGHTNASRTHGWKEQFPYSGTLDKGTSGMGGRLLRGERLTRADYGGCLL